MVAKGYCKKGSSLQGRKNAQALIQQLGNNIGKLKVANDCSLGEDGAVAIALMQTQLDAEFKSLRTCDHLQSVTILCVNVEPHSMTTKVKKHGRSCAVVGRSN